jgi:uncharacterized protein YyaL (SSP411 family)
MTAPAPQRRRTAARPSARSGAGVAPRSATLRRCAVVALACLAALASCARDEPPRQVAIVTLPGAEQFSPELARRLAAAARDGDAAPRTRHLAADGTPLYTNRLALETSPYLRQHAHNPVDWYPWGDDAFAAARRLGRPVFLSIGYATCHWCHVMERESFEDPEVARLLNERFVAIKVDREERPDVDDVYMAAVQAMTGGGGWPMTIVATPSGEPFFAATYLPPHDGEHGFASGLTTVLTTLAERYAADPQAVASQAAEIARALRAAAHGAEPGGVPDASALEAARAQLAASFDPQNGGFGGAPKFPRTSTLELLLRVARRTGDGATRAMVVRTLERVADGGIRDHVGGGFHRYSTDRAWRVPHFEKMLYDNALLATIYLEAYQVTGRADFAAVARSVLDSLTRDMMADNGAFYAATDADSPAPGGQEEEGRYFTWTPAELAVALGPDRAALVAARYGVSDAGDLGGRSVLHVAASLDDVARDAGLTPGQAQDEIAASLEQLRSVRATRPPPLRDDAIVAGWNGLAISAFARASRVLGDEHDLRVAERAADFVLGHMVRGGVLARAWTGGAARHDAVLEDQASLIAGLLDLYEASFAPRWLAAALELQADLDARFGDPVGGGYFATAAHGEALLLRDKPVYDGAVPSGNSVAAMNLLRLAELTGDERYRDAAARLFASFAAIVRSEPLSVPRMLVALDFFLDTPKEIVLIAPADLRETQPLVAEVGRTFLPNAVVAAATEPDAAARAALVPLLADRKPLGGRATAYVCEHRVCKLPVFDVAALRTALADVTPYVATTP